MAGCTGGAVRGGAGRSAIGFDDIAGKAKGAAESGAKGKVEKEVNAKLLAEGRKNQCSFKSGQRRAGARAATRRSRSSPTRWSTPRSAQTARRQGLQVRGLGPHRLERQGGAQQGAVGQARGGHRQGAGGARHLAERDHLRRHGLRAAAGHARQHAGQEGQEPPLRDPGPALTARRTRRAFFAVFVRGGDAPPAAISCPR